MELDSKNVTSDKLMTTGDFVKYLQAKFLNNKITHETVLYNLKNTDRIDYVIIGTYKLIVFNEKAQNFIPGAVRERRKK